MSLLQGTPLSSFSATTSATETPTWMQEAVYNQVVNATNTANTPFQAYNNPTVAELSPLQQQAYSQIQNSQGQWAPAMNIAQAGTMGLASAPGGYAAAQPYAQKAEALNGTSLAQYYMDNGLQQNGYNAAQPALNQQQGLLSSLNYNAPTDSLTPYVNQAVGQNGMAAANPYMQNQAAGLGSMNTQAGVNALNPYLNQAVNANGVNAASPYLNQQANALTGMDTNTAANTLNPYVQSSINQGGLQAANPYLQQSAQSSANGIQDFMNPYQQQVMDTMASQAGRNLSENLLPAVSDAFVKAGQFGGSRMGEFGSRAVRDTQESLLNQQGQLAQQGFGQALSASQQEQARQAQLASTAGNLGSQQQSAVLAGGQAMSAAQQAAMQQELARAGQLGQVGSQLGSLTQAQQQALLASGQAASGAQNQALTQQLAQSGQYGQMAGQAGALTQAQQQALLSSGQAMSSSQQAAIQAALSGAGQYGQMGSTLGGLTQAQQSAMMQAGQNLGTLTQGQQQLLASLGQQAGTLAQGDIQNQQSALAQLANMAQQGQSLGMNDNAALEAAGAAQQNQQQQQLTSGYNQWMQEQLYPRQQLDWLSTQIRGMSPITPQVNTVTQNATGQNYAPSGLSQLASGMAAGAGLYNSIN
jgi:hypothetical protein